MNDFETLKQEVLVCEKCPLSQTRNNVVFGNGNPNAEIMLIAEGPGYYEDKSGIVFQGKSGELLDKILTASGFSRDEHIFISNIVKCRPPDNRQPNDTEKAACLPYLYQQIELVNPKIIILLGATALKELIDPNARITQIRGQWIDWKDRLVMPTYHPSALLRNPTLKRPVWEDFKNVVAKYRELVNPEHYSAHC
ncbi:uracil-DNA glycosylase [Ancylomarina sp. 16SWW S1-10-2]|uniref:uracil-DNA glycosylase n=1 Tax=Ancylomarina sp. 16SWW S1-10-2 TaxID=2499681 RepID=UPI0012ADAA2C|nr:uracil-DNA glycosylase [Ancylomarina sp. 16SWW S1-10-2]MRT92512.1 uracil-DNA glycosylase [Ancylomarina sp. 16SWW S1-10-2]